MDALLSLRPKFTKHMKVLLENGTLHVRPIRLNMRRKPHWDHHLATCDDVANGLPPSPSGTQPIGTKQRGDTHRAVSFLRDFQLLCPACKHAKPHFGFTPFDRGKWKKSVALTFGAIMFHLPRTGCAPAVVSGLAADITASGMNMRTHIVWFINILTNTRLTPANVIVLTCQCPSLSWTV